MATNSNRTPLSHTRYVCQHNIAKYPTAAFTQVLYLTSPLCVHSHSSTAPSHTSESRGQTPSSFNEDDEDEDEDNPSSPEWSWVQRWDGGNATQEISCHSSLYYQIWTSFTISFLLFPSLAQTPGSGGDGLLYFCGAFRLASRGSGE